MGGFTYEPRTFVIEFSESQLEGLELRARAFSIDELLEVLRLEAGFTAQMPDEVDALLNKFLATAISWNMQCSDGTQVPLTRDGVGGLDHGFVTLVVRGWMKAVTGGIPDPLDDRSDSGVTSLEELLPMDPL